MPSPYKLYRKRRIQQQKLLVPVKAPERQSVESGVYTVPEAAKRLGIGRTTAYAAVKSGEIPSIHIFRCVRVPRWVVERLLAGTGLKEVNG